MINTNFFNLELVQVMVCHKINGGAALSSQFDAAYRGLQFFISGLNWINSSYDAKTKNNRALAYLYGFSYAGTIFISTTNDDTNRSYELTNLFFKKSSQYVNLRIILGSLNDDFNEFIPATQITSSAANFPHFALKFNIRPIEDI